VAFGYAPQKQHWCSTEPKLLRTKFAGSLATSTLLLLEGIHILKCLSRSCLQTIANNSSRRTYGVEQRIRSAAQRNLSNIRLLLEQMRRNMHATLTGNTWMSVYTLVVMTLAAYNLNPLYVRAHVAKRSLVPQSSCCLFSMFR
jgi:hypothetical protein